MYQSISTMNSALLIVVLINSVLSSMAEEALVPIAKPQQPPLTASLNSFAFKLLKGLEKDDKNTFFSPLSVSAALAMVLAGAEGQTEKELKNNLDFEQFKNQHDINEAFHGLFENIQKDKSDTTVQFASRAMIAKDITIRKPFIDTLKRDYSAEAVSTDFHNAQAAKNDVNKWVRDHTNQKIPEILASPLPTETKLILLNAIYFRGEWENRFNVDLTKRGTFKGSHGNSNTNVMFMEKTLSSEIFVDNSKGYKMLSLPYHGDISMVIILPDVGKTIFNILQSLTSKQLDSNLKASRHESVHLKLPKFKVEETYELSSALQKLGIRQVFRNDANLSGISKTSLKVDQVVHKALCEVDERGTVAAAATVIKLIRTAIIVPAPVEFFVERPFAFFIKDSSAGYILFAGIINKL